MPRRLSFQLYSARNFQPWEDVLAHLSQCGYRDVEGFGGPLGLPGAIYDDPHRFRSLLDKYDLYMPTGHIFPLAVLEQEPQRIVSAARTIGLTHIYCPYVTPEERRSSSAYWKDFGKRLEGVGRFLRDEGIGFGWHSHDFEFTKLKDGSFPIDRIFEGGPMLDWECDLGWLIKAGQNPSYWLKTYGERITAVHIKDNARPGEHLDPMGQSNIGEGIADWPSIFRLIRSKTRCLHYVVEHDDPKDFRSFAKTSFDYLAQI